MTELKHKDVTEKIIQCFYEVLNELGCGFLESVYQNALYLSLREAGFHVEAQKEINVYFRGQIVGMFKPDLIVNETVIIEIKAIKALNESHASQLLNYLKATEMEIGFLINYGLEFEFKRFAN